MGIHSKSDFNKAVKIWSLSEIFVCVVSSLWVEWRISIEGALFFSLVATCMAFIHTTTVALIIWKTDLRRPLLLMGFGATLGLVTPIALYLSIWACPWFRHIINAILFGILSCVIPLVGFGVLGGTWVAYIRFQIQSRK